MNEKTNSNSNVKNKFKKDKKMYAGYSIIIHAFVAKKYSCSLILFRTGISFVIY